MSTRTASSLLTTALQQQNNPGKWECHWCAAPCDDSIPHDDMPQTPFVKNPHCPKRPANAYVCRGCWLWRRLRQPILFLASGCLDIQSPQNHSWWITEEGAWGIRYGDYDALYRRLLQPSKQFVLALRDSPKAPPNHIHLAVLNEAAPIMQKDTVLTFTLNNVPFQYTVYELETALRDKTPERFNGKLSGVRALITMLGEDIAPQLKPLPEPSKERGRPPVLPTSQNTLKKIVRPFSGKSGR